MLMHYPWHAIAGSGKTDITVATCQCHTNGVDSNINCVKLGNLLHIANTLDLQDSLITC